MSDDILNLTPPKADIRIPYGSDPNQFLDLRAPKEKGMHPLAICIHGGFWRAKYDLEYLGHMCAALAEKGIATANLEYRRVGNAGGGWPGSFADIRVAYQFLRQNSPRYQIDPARVTVLGHSAGGQLALCLTAHEAEVKSAVSLAGLVDLQQTYELHLSHDAAVEFMGGRPSEVPDHYREADPMRLAIRAGQWLIQGDADDIVPPGFSKDYVSKKLQAKETATLVAIAGAGHFDIVDPRSAAWQQVAKTIVEAGKPLGSDERRSVRRLGREAHFSV